MSRILSIIEALAESSWDTLLYHGTFRKFDRPNPGSHFGSPEAATKIIRGIGRDANTVIHAYKYKPSGKSVDVEDTWGNSSPAPHIVSQMHSKGMISKFEHDAVQSNLAKSTGAAHGVLPKGRFNTHEHILGQFLKSKGISSVSYKNQEEDVGSRSHIIYDPENLHRVHTFHNPNAVTHFKARMKQPEFKKYTIAHM